MISSPSRSRSVAGMRSSACARRAKDRTNCAAHADLAPTTLFLFPRPTQGSHVLETQRDLFLGPGHYISRTRLDRSPKLKRPCVADGCSETTEGFASLGSGRTEADQSSTMLHMRHVRSAPRGLQWIQKQVRLQSTMDRFQSPASRSNKHSRPAVDSWPVIDLPRTSHSLLGTFGWPSLPNALPIPPLSDDQKGELDEGVLSTVPIRFTHTPTRGRLST